MNRRLEQQQKQVKFENEQSKAASEQRKLGVDIDNAILSGKEKTVDIANKLTENQKNLLINNPNWEIILKTKTITPEQADYFNKKLGTNLNAATWQEIKEIERNGSTLYRPEFSPNYRVNPTLQADPKKIPVGMTVTTGEGETKTEKTFPVLPKDALEYDYRAKKDAADAQTDLEKAERAETVKTTEVNFESEADWCKQTQTARNKIPGLEKTVQNLDVQIQEMDAYIKSNPSNDMSDQQRIVTGLKTDRNKYAQELEVNKSIASMEKPKTFSLPARPNKGKNSRRGSYSVGNIQDIINRGNR